MNTAPKLTVMSDTRFIPAAATPAIEVLSYRQYRNADHPGLGAILADFASHNPPVSDCVIATAGHAQADGSVISVNLPWPLSSGRIRDELGFRNVHLVNDFEAVAHAAAHMGDSQVLQLAGPTEMLLPRGASAATRTVLGLGLSAALNAPIEDTKFGVFRM